MRAWLALAAAAVASLGSALPLKAQTLVGTWQTIIGPQRQVAKFTKTPAGRLHGEYYNVGGEFYGTLNGHPISTIEVKGRHVHFAFDEEDIAFDGELSADGNTLAGHAVGGTELVTFHRATAKTAWRIDPSPHKARFVTVEDGVRLEVLDWGGDGPPLILLPGLGDTAHVFDDFAAKFTGKHHVYGITRRGFGLSGRPAPTEENYDADRLGDDVLAVIAALKLDRPVIAGHSIAGEELSSIGTRHPERVSGLIYLDAGYGYAFYDPRGDTSEVDMSTVRRDLAQMPLATPSQQKVLIAEMQATLPPLQKGLQKLQKEAEDSADRPPPSRQTLMAQIDDAILTSERKYTEIKPPVLAIFASPRECTADCDSAAVKAEKAARAATADAFEAGTPQARVVRIGNSNHFVFRSNGGEVVREMNAFMDSLH